MNLSDDLALLADVESPDKPIGYNWGVFKDPRWTSALRTNILGCHKHSLTLSASLGQSLPAYAKATAVSPARASRRRETTLDTEKATERPGEDIGRGKGTPLAPATCPWSDTPHPHLDLGNGNLECVEVSP